jgi:hypothetical protein
VGYPLVCLRGVLLVAELVALALVFLLAVSHLLVVLRPLLVALQRVRLQVLVLPLAIRMGFLVMLVFHELLEDLADLVRLRDITLHRRGSLAFPYARCVG